MTFFSIVQIYITNLMIVFDQNTPVQARCSIDHDESFPNFLADDDVTVTQCGIGLLCTGRQFPVVSSIFGHDQHFSIQEKAIDIKHRHDASSMAWHGGVEYQTRNISPRYRVRSQLPAVILETSSWWTGLWVPWNSNR